MVCFILRGSSCPGQRLSAFSAGFGPDGLRGTAWIRGVEHEARAEAERVAVTLRQIYNEASARIC